MGLEKCQKFIQRNVMSIRSNFTVTLTLRDTMGWRTGRLLSLIGLKMFQNKNVEREREGYWQHSLDRFIPNELNGRFVDIPYVIICLTFLQQILIAFATQNWPIHITFVFQFFQAFFCIIWILTATIWTIYPNYPSSFYLSNIYLLEINLLFGAEYTSQDCTRAASFTLLIFLNKYAILFYSRFILLMSLFYADHLVSIILFNYDYLNSTTILLCLFFYSLYYNFVNMNLICNNNNLWIRLSFHFTYDTDE